MHKILARYKIIFPSEHGSWSLMFTPFIIGAGLAGRWPPEAWLGALAALALFLARQPIGLWVRVRRGRGRSEDGPAATMWGAALLAITGLAGAGLLVAGRWPVLWLAIPAVGVLALTLGLGAWLGPRRLGVEVMGVIGLALAAPAAYVAATGRLDATSWLAWAISGLHNVISVLYVRLRIDQKHDRASRAQAISVVGAHGVSLMVVAGMAALGWLHPLIALPMALLLLRALYVAWRKPPIENVKRFGFLEMGFALAFAALVIVAFVMAR